MLNAANNQAVLLNKLVNENDPQAFAGLYDSYAPALLGVIMKQVNDLPVAEEILQDVFVKVWKHISQYDAAKATLFTWMLNITKNTCIDYWRSKQMSYARRLKQYQQQEIKNSNVTETVAENKTGVNEAVRLLTDEYKTVIEMVYLMGYSQQEVSTLLKIPLGTVKTRCRAGLKNLREYYAKENLLDKKTLNDAGNTGRR